MKRWKIFVILMFVVMLPFGFAACGKKTTATYTISFETNGGSAIESISVKEGNRIELPKDPEKTCHLFEGWCVDKSLVTEFKKSQKISSNITLYAKWKENHDFEVTREDSTCTEEGTETKKCTVCGKTETKTIARHHFENGACKDCGYIDNGLEYDENGAVSGIGKYKGTDLIIPLINYNGTPITTIKANAFEGCTQLTSVEIPYNVTKIEDGAFSGCIGLTKISGSAQNVATVIKQAGLEPTKLAGEAGEGTESGEIGETGEGTESGETEETAKEPTTYEIIISCGKNIGKDTFKGCKNLTKVTISSRVETIGENAFSGCTGITEISGAADLIKKVIDQAKLNESESKYSITIPEGITTIAKDTFNGCTNLTSVILPESLTTIGDGAFTGCTNIEKITSPAKPHVSGQTSMIKTIIKQAQPKSYEVVFTCGKIDYEALKDCKNLKKVTIRDGVEGIVGQAFSGCTGLESIVIPKSVTTIGGKSFKDCTSLVKIEIPDSVKEIGGSAFSGCTGLTKVTIGSGVTSIGANAFYGCKKLSEIIIPDNVEEIGESAFWGCTGLKSVKLSNNIKELPSYVFNDCTSLETIILPNDLKEIKIAAFLSCNNIKHVSGPVDMITKIIAKNYATKYEIIISCGDSIAYQAFKDYVGLTKVIIADSVTTIGEGAFSGCTSLEEIVVPSSVTSIGKGAFEGCSTLNSITLPFVGDGSSDITHFGYIFGADSHTQNNSKIPTTLANVLISGGPTIGAYAFYGCDHITSISLPERATAIGAYAFKDCSGLTEIVLPNTATIGENAFKNCSRLTKISGTVDMIKKVIEQATSTTYEITVSCGSIADEAFKDDKNLKSVTIAEGVSIGKDAFSGCTNIKTISGSVDLIKEVIAQANLASYEITISSGDIIGNAAFKDHAGLTKVTIGSGVTSIGERAFSGCTNLKTATIGSGVKTIGEGAFSDCTMLTKVTIEGSVKTIGKSAFEGCERLSIITIPDNVTTIGAYAFKGCTKLATVTIKNRVESTVENGVTKNTTIGVTTIGEGAFEGCTKLSSITIPSSVTTIGKNAFKGCTDLQTVTIGSGVTSIKEGTFSDCTRLSSITIPSSVTTIGASAFKGCSGLTGIIVPSSVTSIGKGAFEGCSALNSITLPFVGDGSSKTHFGHIFGADSYIQNYSKIPTELTSVLISGGATTIGDDAFYGCEYITSISLPESLTTIGTTAFSGCSGLTELVIPSSVTSIEEGVFSGCTGLSSITISDKVTTIGANAFAGCSGLTEITFSGTKDGWNAVTKGEGWAGTIKTIHCSDGDITLE